MNEKLSRAAVIAAHVFKSQGWTWSVRDGKDVPPYVPNDAEIAEEFGRHIRDVEAESCQASTSGRLMVQKDEMGVKELFLSLGSLGDTDG